jgi:putative tricarboxylic transport membrane protein
MMGLLDAVPDAQEGEPGRTGRLSRLQVPLGQFGLAALGFYVAVEARSLGLWTDLGPGPGLLPLVLGLALLGLTGIWVVQTVLERRRGDDDDEQRSGEPLDRTYVIGVVGGLLLLAATMDLLGFQISMALFLFAELKWLGRQRWWLCAVVALVGSVGTFVLFDRVLGVQLPLSWLPALAAVGL